MKQRVISSLYGLVLLAVVIFLFDTLFLNITIITISMLAAYELLNATNLLKYRGFAVIGAAFSLFIPFATHKNIKPFIPVFFIAIIVSLLVSVVYYHSTLKVEQIIMGMAFASFVPLGFSCVVFIRDTFGSSIGMYLLLFALCSAWLSDTGAYFAGRAFGKHKLAPVISPNKTIEGAIGGILTALVLNVGIAFLFSWIMSLLGETITINYLLVAVFTPVISGLSIMGDLTASAIKRQYDVKDYGHIMPGHGGIMDRFDSAIVTVPIVYLLSQIISFAV